MRFLFAVMLPLAFQVMFTLGVISMTNGSGSFVGLGGMLGGLMAIPLTAQVNWRLSDPARGAGVAQRFQRIFFVTLIFPALLLLLLAVAS